MVIGFDGKKELTVQSSAGQPDDAPECIANDVKEDDANVSEWEQEDWEHNDWEHNDWEQSDWDAEEDDDLFAVDEGAWGETYDDMLDDDEEDDSDVPAELTRAWRAAVIGAIVLPPVVTLYSVWILIRNRFFLDRTDNWRIAAAVLLNGLVLSIATWIILAFLTPQPPPSGQAAPGDAIAIPLLP